MRGRGRRLLRVGFVLVALSAAGGFVTTLASAEAGPHAGWWTGVFWAEVGLSLVGLAFVVAGLGRADADAPDAEA